MTLPTTTNNGGRVTAVPTIALGWDHTLYFDGQQNVQSELPGGDYIWRVEASAWAGKATLQFLGMDGTTWFDVKARDGTTIEFSANGAERVTIGQGATVRVNVTGGVPARLYSNLASI